MNKISHLSTGKLLVPKNEVGGHVPTWFIVTVQGDCLPHFSDYVWLVLSNTLGHNRSWGWGGVGGQENRAEIVNKLM